jgi:hypothetical protein
MADNLSVTPGIGADVRTIKRAGIDTQVMQLDIGGEAAETLVAGAMPTTMGDGANATQGAKADAAYTDVTGAASASELAILKGAFVKMAAGVASLATLVSDTTALGQTTMANSMPVVLASNDSAVVALQALVSDTTALGQAPMSGSMPTVPARDYTGIAGIPCAAADVNVPAVNTAAVVTYAGVSSVKHVITGIAWSYSGADPTAGNLKIEDVSGTTVFTMDITSQGAGIIVFPKPKKSAAVNTAMIVTLAAGGASAYGKVSVLDHYTEA